MTPGSKVPVQISIPSSEHLWNLNLFDFHLKWVISCPNSSLSPNLYEDYFFRVENVTVMWTLPIGGDKPTSASLRVNHPK